MKTETLNITLKKRGNKWIYVGSNREVIKSEYAFDILHSVYMETRKILYDLAIEEDDATVNIIHLISK